MDQRKVPHRNDPVTTSLCQPIIAHAFEHCGHSTVPADTNEDLWVFGYGSLMWRPGFEYLERVPARITGLHRSLCIYSLVHRGTPEGPGLELGLDRGGSCRGIAYRVAAVRRPDTIAYLREREQVTKVYVETMRRIALTSTQPRVAVALVYVVDRSHPQYAGPLDLERQLHLVRQGRGQSGSNRDYVLSTVSEIEAQGCRDSSLQDLARRLKGEHHLQAGGNAAHHEGNAAAPTRFDGCGLNAE
jgi:cation transport protein ChaC